MSDGYVKHHVQEGIATVTFHHPKSNSLPGHILRGMADAIAACGKDPSVRVIVLRSDGEKAFCAGASFDELVSIDDAKTGLAFFSGFAHVINAIRKVPVLVIGRIHANAFGGGVGMMAVCDVAVGATGARFGLTETRLGLIPATIGPYVLARMGEAMARRVFMSARLFTADEAVALGLLARAVAPGDLDAAIEAEVKPYLACAPGAVAASKALALRLGGAINRDQIAHSIGQLVSRWESPEAAEGIAAFFGKRKADWMP